MLNLRSPGRRAGVVAIAMVLIVVAACTNKFEIRAGGGDVAVDQGQLPDGPAVRGGELKLGIEANIGTLNVLEGPAQESDILILRSVYDALITYSPIDAKPVPGLATEVTPSADFTTWTAKLRTGVTFHDGTPFDAAAVVRNFTWRQDPALGCKCDPVFKVMTSVTAPDSQTVVWTFSEPVATFNVALPSLYIVAPSAIDGGGDLNRVLIGTGAFKLQDRDTLRFVRNPTYWKTDAAGGALPYLDAVTFIPVPDSVQRLAALTAGDVDMIQTADTANIVSAEKDKSLQIQRVTGSSSTVLLFNLSKPPYDDVRARRLAAYAIDRQAINVQYYAGTKTAPIGLFSKDSPWTADFSIPGFDADKAKELAAELVKDKGPDALVSTVSCIKTPEADAILAITQQQLAKLGITVKLNQTDQGLFVNDIVGKTGNYQSACFRTPDIVDPDELYNTIVTGEAGNVMFYSNPEVDRLMKQGRQLADFAKRKEIYDRVQQILAEDLPVLPLLADLAANIHTQAVRGLPKPQPGGLGLIELAFVQKQAG